MNALGKKEQVTEEVNAVLTGLLLEFYAGVIKKEDALEILENMKAAIMPAIRAIDKTADDIRGK